MLIGMLWADEDPRSRLDQRVMAAKRYYERKYGGVADYCLLSGKEFVDGDLAVLREVLDGMKFILASDILPRHLVIGKMKDCKETFDEYDSKE